MECHTKLIFNFQPSIFRCYISFREGKRFESCSFVTFFRATRPEAGPSCYFPRQVGRFDEDGGQAESFWMLDSREEVVVAA